MNIKFKKIHEDAILPKYAHESDAGIDFYALKDYNTKDKFIKVRTGLVWEPDCDDKVVLLIQDKSSKSFLYKCLGGVIDKDYRGEIMICIRKYRKKTFIKKGEKIAQGIIFTIPKVNLIEVDKINTETDRGLGGFGSTGE